MRLPTFRTRHVAASVVLMMGAASGCEYAAGVAPEVTARPVVHAVLNPALARQTVIVEKTQRSSGTPGSIPVRDPITDARVVVYGPREDSVVATPSTNGAYVIQSVTVLDGSAGTAAPNVLRIRPGERYRLRVESSLGVTTGETTLPVGGAPDVEQQTFNIDRDTLKLAVPVGNAAGYLIRVETPFDAIERYTTSLGDALILPLALEHGDLEQLDWAFSFARGVMMPGLPNRIMVAAVDSNFFRYNAAGFDPFGDDTRGNSLKGGVGVFGGVATVMTKTLDLTSNPDLPFEGTWVADTPPTVLPSALTIYSSPHFPEPFPGTSGSAGGSATGLLGKQLWLTAFVALNRTDLSIRFIDPAAADRPIDAFSSMSGGALVLNYNRGAERITYHKR